MEIGASDILSIAAILGSVYTYFRTKKKIDKQQLDTIEENKQYKKRTATSKIKNTVLILSLLFSIAALCLSLFRCPPITYDWMAVIVSVLSLLTTVLLGWQIFSLFNINKIKDDFKKEKVSIFKDQIEVRVGMNVTMFEFMVRENYKPGIFKYGVFLLKQFNQLGDYEAASAYVEAMIAFGKGGLEMSYFDKSALWSDFHSCPDLHKVAKIEILEKMIMDIKVLPNGNADSYLKYRDRKSPI